MKTVIIAEAGVNHNGSPETAVALVDAAAQSGADFVKFQTFSAENIATAAVQKVNYQKLSTDTNESQLDMLRRLELSKKQHSQLVKRSKQLGIRFLSTGFDTLSIDMLCELGVEYLKVPSGEITNLPYLRYVAGKNIPVILSTGMANMAEIASAIDVFESVGLKRSNLTVLHCSTEYPTPMELVNLNAMQTIRNAFHVEVGYSDHTRGIEVPIAAVALGATVIEKHFTLDRGMAGPDHAASLEPNELQSMVTAIRNIERAMGDGLKRANEREKSNIIGVRKSIVARIQIQKGETLTAGNLAVKRPGSGLSPMLWDQLIGSKAVRTFERDELIEW